MSRALKIIVGIVFLGLFIGLWGTIAILVLIHDPSATAPPPVDEFLASIAGLSAGVVASATAGALGISAQAVRNQNQPATPLKVAEDAGALVNSAAVIYVLVGLVMVIIRLVRPETSPELVVTFATSAFGWLAGAFTALVPTR